MRIFEIIIILLCLFWMYANAAVPCKKKSRWLIYIILSCAVFILHIAFEGYRIQMLPAYLVLFYHTLWAVYNFKCVGKRHIISKVLFLFSSAISAVLLITSFVLSEKFPVTEIQKTTGKYKVGKCVRYVTDELRNDFHSENDNAKRELMIEIWYPAEANTDTKEVKYPGWNSFVYSKLTYVPEYLLSHIELIETNSYINPGVSDEESLYPLLIYSHGWGESSSSATYLTEELASNGYIVVSINHTYGAGISPVKDGRMIEQTEKFDPLFVSNDIKLLSEQWTTDVLFVYRKIAEYNNFDSEGIFTGKIDTVLCGYFGHSFGGSIVSEILAKDNNFKAGINLDGKSYYSNEPPKNIYEPFMNINAQFTYPDMSESVLNDLNLNKDSYLQLKLDHARRLRSHFDNLKGTAYNIIIKGAIHNSFIDLPAFSSFFTSGITGISVEKTHTLIREYVTGFFDKHLKKKLVPLLDGYTKPPYEEIMLEYKEAK